MLPNLWKEDVNELERQRLIDLGYSHIAVPSIKKDEWIAPSDYRGVVSKNATTQTPEEIMAKQQSAYNGMTAQEQIINKSYDNMSPKELDNEKEKIRQQSLMSLYKTIGPSTMKSIKQEISNQETRGLPLDKDLGQFKEAIDLAEKK